MAMWNANYALTSLFTFEVLLKLFGLGFWDYIRDGFNIFDFIIVGLSLTEIALSSVAGMNALRCVCVPECACVRVHQVNARF